MPTRKNKNVQTPKRRRVTARAGGEKGKSSMTPTQESSNTGNSQLDDAMRIYMNQGPTARGLTSLPLETLVHLMYYMPLHDAMKLLSTNTSLYNSEVLLKPVYLKFTSLPLPTGKTYRDGVSMWLELFCKNWAVNPSNDKTYSQRVALTEDIIRALLSVYVNKKLDEIPDDWVYDEWELIQGGLDDVIGLDYSADSDSITEGLKMLVSFYDGKYGLNILDRIYDALEGLYIGDEEPEDIYDDPVSELREDRENLKKAVKDAKEFLSGSRRLGA